jgi:Ca2+-binding EF-hand superfamily protein
VFIFIITHTRNDEDSEEKAREVLGSTDLNGDGAISYDEFKASRNLQK